MSYRTSSFKPSAKDTNSIKEWYDKLETGRFTGNAPSLQWIGSDLFIFYKHNEFPFAYITSKGENIEPSTFSTDGGSTPVFIRGLPNMSPWHYGAAYIIHDWLWYLNKKNQPICTFEESNLILCEAIKTLIINGYLGHANFTGDAGTVYNVYRGVQSSIARRRWERNNHA